MFIDIYTYIHVHIPFTEEWLQARMSSFKFSYTYTYIYLCTHIYVYTCIDMHIYTYAYVCVCINHIYRRAVASTHVIIQIFQNTRGNPDSHSRCVTL